MIFHQPHHLNLHLVWAENRQLKTWPRVLKMGQLKICKNHHLVQDHHPQQRQSEKFLGVAT